MFEDLYTLSVPLPEDILKAKGGGDYALVMRLIEKKCADPCLPQALRKRLELERIISAQVPKEYPYTEAEARELLEKKIGPVSDEEWQELFLSGQIDWIYIKGVLHFQDCFLSNLMKTRMDLAERAVKKGTLPVPSQGPNLLDETIRELKEKGELTLHYHMRSTMTVHPDEQHEGKPVRVWLPLPNEYAQIKNVKVLSCTAPACELSPADWGQRTICMSGVPGKDVFSVEYSFDIVSRYVEPRADQVSAWQPSFDTGESLPHIRFTPYLKALAAQIVGAETNPLLKAKKIYEYITQHIRYSFMRAYITMPMITEFAAAGGKGDCGVQALLFITLCRIAGIPARWQSGLYTEPGDVGCHDWAQFYIAPYGWLFCDCSFGGSAWRKGKTERWHFYFGNLDPYRMPANSEYQHDFVPVPKYLRYDPYDNQLGEAEYEDGQVQRSLRSTHHEILEVSGADALKLCPSGQDKD